MVQNYDNLLKKMESNERHSFSYWTNLIKKTLDEVDGKAIRRTVPPKEEKLVTFSEYREWAKSLGTIMGWSKESD